MLDFTTGSVSAFAYRNRKKRLFIPSKINKFDRLVIEDVMIDSGCGSLLLPLKYKQLYDLINIFPESTHIWKITESKGVSGNSAILSIQIKLGEMSVNLASDISNCSFKVNIFRFHLCSEDLSIIKEISSTIKIFNLDIVDNYINNKIDRRRHALIGQILSDTHNGLSVQMSDVFICYSSIIDINNISNDITLLVGNRDKYVAKYGKETFNDLEDEDHDVLDEEDDIYHGDLIDEESY